MNWELSDSKNRTCEKMKYHHKRGLHMLVRLLDRIKIMLSVCTIILAGIGLVILLPFLVLVALGVAFLSAAFFRSYMIVQKGLSIASLKSIGFRCWAVVSASVSAFAHRMISRLESCLTFAHMTHHLSLIDKVGLVAVVTLHTLIFLILIFFYFLK